ncbi:MAG: hypothetical protein QG597_1726 [Actinomycetota bacterium]|nr:hypothetical protein [Actinomycetota bacterium]
MTGGAGAAGASLPDVGAAASRLAGWEADLDPAHPERSGLRVLAHGEISATLIVPDPLFTSLVAKRMTGFPDEAAVAGYVDLVTGYINTLRAAGVTVVDTAVVPVPRAARTSAVYLLQPQLPADGLGNSLLHTVDDAALTALIRAVLTQVDATFAGGDADTELAIDAQLSNWWLPTVGDGATPALIDVGTPFVRVGGVYQMAPRILLSAVPPGVRSWYLWRRTGEQYMDDYFDRRLVGLDLLGNFIKEGAAARIPVGLAAVNDWLGADGPITPAQVSNYYDDDAATLELFLRVRRADRWLRTRVMRRRYDFILPGPVRRNG